MTFSSHPQLFQILTAGLVDLELPDGTVSMHEPRMVPQWFVYAPNALRAALSQVPEVLRVTTTESDPARFAVGFDHILAAGREAATQQPNGWAGRDGLGGSLPPCPRVAEGGVGIEMDYQLVEPTVIFDLASVVLAKEPPHPADEVDPADPVGVSIIAAFEVGVTPILPVGNGGPATTGSTADQKRC